MIDGPAPQYDFCGQRGPVKREMSQSDRYEQRGLGEIEGKHGKGLQRPFFCGAPPNERITVYGTSMWCDIPARVDAQYGWDKWRPADNYDGAYGTSRRGDISQLESGL